MKRRDFYSKGPNSTLMDTQYIPQKMWGGEAFVFQTEVPGAGIWSSLRGRRSSREAEVTLLSPLGSLERGGGARVPQAGGGMGKVLCGGAGSRWALGCSDPGGGGSTSANLSREPEGKCGLSSPLWAGGASQGSLLLLSSDAWNFPLCFWCGTCSPWKFPN